jgi:hypothetical protein
MNVNAIMACGTSSSKFFSSCVVIAASCMVLQYTPCANTTLKLIEPPPRIKCVNFFTHINLTQEVLINLLNFAKIYT